MSAYEGGWISVTDRMPETQQFCLVRCSDGVIMLLYYTWNPDDPDTKRINEFTKEAPLRFYTPRFEEIQDVTHWAPLDPSLQSIFKERLGDHDGRDQVD